MKHILIALIVFLTTAAHAGTYGYFCQSKNWEIDTNDNRYFLKTVSCNDVSASTPARAQNKAEKICARWGNDFSVSSVKTNFFKDPLKCHKVSVELSNKIQSLRVNKDTSLTDEFYDQYEFTEKFIDNFSHQSAIYHHYGAEQAQWIKRDGQIYCGHLDGDIAIRYLDENTAKTVEVIRPSTSEKALYVHTGERKFQYEAVKELSGIKAKYLSLDFFPTAQNVFFLNKDSDGDRIYVDMYDIYYDPAANECT